MKYADLSEDAKRAAREWYQQIEAETWGQDRAPDLYEDMAECLKFLGIEVKMRTEKWYSVHTKTNHSREAYAFEWSGFCSQGDGLVFEGKWRAADVNLGALMEYAPEDEVLHGIGTQMTALMLRYPQGYATVVTVASGPGLPRMALDECYRGDALDESQDESMDDATYKALKRQLEAAAMWCYRNLESNYEYDTGDEAAVESIEANEYAFDEEGERV